MQFDLTTLQQGYTQWNDLVRQNMLPKWEELPEIELYMDQVVMLIDRYLGFLKVAKSDETVITSSMVNNYVKIKIVPPPVKKRYGKAHLVYLIMVCILKQTLNISAIQHLLPVEEKQEKAKEIYAVFYHNFNSAVNNCCSRINDLIEPVLQSQSGEACRDMTMQAAVSANMFKLFTEKMIHMTAEEKNEEEREEK